MDNWEDDDSSEVVVTKVEEKKVIDDEIKVHDTSKEDAKLKESRK